MKYPFLYDIKPSLVAINKESLNNIKSLTFVFLLNSCETKDWFLNSAIPLGVATHSILSFSENTYIVDQENDRWAADDVFAGWPKVDIWWWQCELPGND